MPAFVLTVEYSQATANAALLEKGPPDGSTRRLVVVFSRSGNTAVVGQYVAQEQKADFVRLRAPRYELGFWGWLHALQDARTSGGVLVPAQVDLAPYDTVFIGSPVWLYCPAPPAWKFAESHRFDGKHVVLFNTYNSTFAPEYIDAFQQLVERRGAASFRHRAVLRGRMGQQISAEQMLETWDGQPAEHANPK